MRVAISLPYGMSARNVLRGSAYGRLREAAEITLLTPLADDPVFLREFSDERVAIKRHPSRIPLSYRALRLLLDAAEGYWFTRTHRVRTLEILAEVLRHERPWLYRARVALGRSFGASHRSVFALRGMQQLFLPTADALEALRAAAPDVVVLTHPLAIQEFPLAFAARQLGIPVVSMVHSWDNLTAKSGIRTVTSNNAGRMLPMAFDHIIVWNEVMRQELERLYGYSRDQITAAGVPQFDIYHNYRASERTAFCAKRGLVAELPIVTYAAGSSSLLRDQASVVKALLDARRSGAFGQPVQIVIRGHPGSNLHEFRAVMAGESGVAFDEPSVAFGAVVAKKGWRGGQEDTSQLADLLAHSAVCINVSSTLALDCAMLDRPIVCVAFDGRERRPYHQSVRKHYDFTHYLPVVESGGVTLANSEEELINAVREYLRHPEKDAEGRRRIVRTLCFSDDGQAGVRIANTILRFASKAHPDHSLMSTRSSRREKHFIAAQPK